MLLTGAEIITKVLMEQGVDRVFGYPGGAAINVYDALYKCSDKITHYQKSGSMWFTNGGKLIITEREYIVKYLFQTVAKFEIDKTVASRLSANPINVGISLSDGVKSINLYFFKKTADKLYEKLKI